MEKVMKGSQRVCGKKRWKNEKKRDGKMRRKKMGKVEIGSKEMTRKIKGKKDCERLIWEKRLDKCMKKNI